MSAPTFILIWIQFKIFWMKTGRLVTVPLNIHWTQTAYAVLCQPHRTEMSSTFVYALILNENSMSLWCGWHRTAYAACVQRILSKMVLRWRRDELLNKVVIFAYKVFSSLHNVTIEPLMADGVFWWCLSYFSVPWQCYLLGSQWDRHKPPGFHPKYLKLCSEDERSFYGYGTTWG